MSLSILGGNYAYTSNGNRYEKSSVGKNIGTAVGISMLVPATKMALKKQGMTFSKFVEVSKKFIKDGPTFGDNIWAICKGPKMAKFMNILEKSKGARVGLLGALVALPVVLYGGIGRLIGHGVDKVIEHGSKKEADRCGKSE